uniref:Dual specificity phosphatase 28 n=1 Tax=Pundamilia nyererei TaxID=303518 RepID=A0A3B4GKH5_9CICH
ARRSLKISRTNARSACSDELIQQEAVTLCINVSKQQPFPSSSITKLQIPIYDDPNEDLYSHFDRCADAIQKEANRGGRSVVYCKNGRSRSATICIAYLMKHRKLSLTDALQVRIYPTLLYFTFCTGYNFGIWC